jgi:hypothetical protein
MYKEGFRTFQNVCLANINGDVAVGGAVRRAP